MRVCICVNEAPKNSFTRIRSGDMYGSTFTSIVTISRSIQTPADNFSFTISDCGPPTFLQLQPWDRWLHVKPSFCFQRVCPGGWWPAMTAPTKNLSPTALISGSVDRPVPEQLSGERVKHISDPSINNVST